METVETVQTTGTEGGDHLLLGEIELVVTLEDGTELRTTLAMPPGAPGRPPTEEELRTKLHMCAGAGAETVAALSWESAAAHLRATLAA